MYSCSRTVVRSMLLCHVAGMPVSSVYTCLQCMVYMSSSVRLSSVTFMRPTQAIEIFDNVSTPFGTLAIYLSASR